MKMIATSNYELIENINLLFENKNIIYGAGNEGRNFAGVMNEAQIEFEAFCDKNIQGEIMGHRVIGIDALYELSCSSQVNIIIASNKYFEEILSEIESKGIVGNIFNVWGVNAAIKRNIHNTHFKKEFRERVLLKQNVITNNSMRKVYITWLQQIVELNPKILIYQMGKVGSRSMYESLLQYNLDCIHIHILNPNGDIFDDMRKDFYACNKLLKTNKLKIITMIREPIAHFVSRYFQEEVFSEKKSIEEDVVEQLDGWSLENYPFQWFKEELEYFTGIDIFQYGFDKERGYTIIKEDNFEILCLQMEKMSLNEQIIGAFVGVENFHLRKDINVREGKPSGEVYKKVKERLEIPENIIERYYKGNKEMDFFYSEEDKREFLKNIKINSRKVEDI